MKKATLIIIISAFMFLVLTSCSAKPYTFKESIDDIVSIEVVSAESSLEFKVIKTLSESEKEEFLEKFQEIKFRSYLGDPTDLYGDAIRITYQSGIYEMICSFASEYVEDGTIQYLWKSCDEKAFNNLLNSFLKEDAN